VTGESGSNDRRRPVRAVQPERLAAAQAAAVMAVGAAAVSFVAGLGAYLFIRFTQHRAPGPGAAGPRAGQPSSPKGKVAR